MIAKIDYPGEFAKVGRHLRKLLNERIQADRSLTQSAIGRAMHKSQNAVNNWLTANEKYQCLPNAVDFLILCRLLRLDPGIFLPRGDVVPEEPASSGEKGEVRYLIPGTPDVIAEPGAVYALPFVKTSVSARFWTLLDAAAGETGISVIETAGKNGSSRALKEYAQAQNPRCIYMAAPVSLEAILEEIKLRFAPASIFQWLKQHKVLIILDHAETLGQVLKELIAGYFFQKHPLVFVQKVFLGRDAMFEGEVTRHFVPAFQAEDLRALCLTCFPAMSRPALALLEQVAGGRMDDLITCLEKIGSAYARDVPLSRRKVQQALFL